MNEIVVGVDGSEGAAAALRWAVAEASYHRAPLVAVLAWSYLDQRHPDLCERFDPAYGERHALDALDAYLAAAGPGGRGDVDVARRAVCDLAAPALLDVAASASLLVVGARGLHGHRGLLVGSVSDKCVRHATVPVAVVRPATSPPDARPNRIVVGVDGSETAQRALQWALAEAQLRGAALRVVHGWHVPYVGTYPYAIAASDPKDYEDAARHTLDDALGRAGALALAGSVEPVLASGGAAEALLGASHDADLIVVGSRGLGGFAGLLLGSVSHQVVHHAACPVVVVRPES